jgi:hypothetical protein
MIQNTLKISSDDPSVKSQFVMLFSWALWEAHLIDSGEISIPIEVLKVLQQGRV